MPFSETIGRVASVTTSLGASLSEGTPLPSGAGLHLSDIQVHGTGSRQGGGRLGRQSSWKDQHIERDGASMHCRCRFDLVCFFDVLVPVTPLLFSAPNLFD